MEKKNRSGVKSANRKRKIGKNSNFGLNPSLRTDRVLVDGKYKTA